MKNSNLLKYKYLTFALLVAVVTELKAQKGWVNLFNGKNLKNWTVKIAKHELNENYGNTFRVKDGMMQVGYEGYSNFDQQYGHIFYKKPYSTYYLKVVYRFTGEQAKGGEGWALRNSGVMLHSQDPKTMLKNQDFPISVEAQFLGGDGVNGRHTSNVCTPGTTVEINNKLFTPHCLDSKSKTYAGEQWVEAEFLVLGDSLIQHILNKEVVLAYTKPKIGGGNVSNFDPKAKQDGKALTAGYIALQSESHPIDFKSVKLFDLAPYVNDKAKLDAILEKIRQK